jgi:hypothetical protein
MNALVPMPTSNAEVYRASTDAAGLCRDIVLKTAQKIGGRQYVKVEGWQAIAIAHGCAASADHVERVEDEGMSGFRAVGIVRRMSDGAEIARAEGFLGDDETVWAKRPVYARRAMVQTRAISRACRSAFAHVVVLIDANLSTTPAEEVPDEGFDDRPPRNVTPRAQPQEARQAARIDLSAEMDACKSKAALLAWEQFRLKEIGKLTKAEGAPLADKFQRLLAKLPDEQPPQDDQDLTDADLMEMAQ